MVNSGILFSVFFKGGSEYSISRVTTNLENMENLENSGGFVKLLKSQGNNFCRKNLENSGKMKNMRHDRQQKYISLNFPLLSCSGK